MFEKITLRHSQSGTALTAGELAEALLYYQNVHLLLDYNSLIGLIQAIGPQSLLKVLRRKNVTATYLEDMLGTHTDDAKGFSVHRFVEVTIWGPEANLKKSRKGRIQERVESVCGLDKKSARLFAERFFTLVTVRHLSGDDYCKGGVARAAMSDLEDATFTTLAIRKVLSNSLPQYESHDVTFRAHVDGQEFVVDTNIDFEKLNRLRRTYRPDLDEIKTGRLANAILTARGDLTLSAHYQSEFLTSEEASQISQLRLNGLLDISSRGWEGKQHFQELLFNEARAVGRAIDEEKRTFDDFFPVLDKAEKFKEWIVGLNPDEKLIYQYMQELNKQPALDSFPIKGLRYLFSLSVGAAVPAVGAAVSAVDSFILDRFAGGWRPSHFVERRLRPFVTTPETD